MSEKVSIRVNAELPDYPSGSVVHVEVDEEGTPLSHYWRRRLKDAERDGCCEVISSRGRSAANLSGIEDESRDWSES